MRLKPVVGILAICLLLVTLALLNALIQGEEVEQVRATAERATMTSFTKAIQNDLSKLSFAVALTYLLEAERIDTVLARYNSPLAGYGIVFVRESRRTGIPATLPAAIAGKESYFGRQCFAPHNAWGMLSYPQGWATWEEGIRASFDWLQGWYGRPQSGYDCPGYCEPDHPWMEDIEANMGVF